MPVPSAQAADRNLLFGILALQLDFVTSETLVRAMHAWVLEKSTPLGQILQEQAALAPERRLLLDALCAEHLKQHDNDPHQSLAAVSPLGSVRDELSRIADIDVQGSLGHLPTGSRPAADTNVTVSSPTQEFVTQASALRFRVLRPHARGGLGEVFIAQDEELHREVALKEMQERHACHPSHRSRFLLEAEITGGLEHPGIVPVYSMGQYADGRPFYAMRFIKGDNLKSAIERFHRTVYASAGERLLQFRKLLGRFLDVCDAIAYAHSRGVLHRDLKPGNIMLGKYGETLVVDWGLAKLQGRDLGNELEEGLERPLAPVSAGDSAPTQMGEIVGTPQFMSPEQAAGQIDRLGPATDVYSLGATLYCLLTGTGPFDKVERGSLLPKVASGDFPRPRHLKTQIHASRNTGNSSETIAI